MEHKVNRSYIGCSGSYYRDRKSGSYSEGTPVRHWFRFYCDHFNTIEINSSFYRMPALATLQK